MFFLATCNNNPISQLEDSDLQLNNKVIEFRTFTDWKYVYHDELPEFLATSVNENDIVMNTTKDEDIPSQTSSIFASTNRPWCAVTAKPTPANINCLPWSFYGGTEARYELNPFSDQVMVGFGGRGTKDRFTIAGIFSRQILSNGELDMSTLHYAQNTTGNPNGSVLIPTLQNTNQRVVIGIGLRSYDGNIRTLHAWTAPYDPINREVVLNSPHDVEIHVYRGGTQPDVDFERLIRTFDTDIGAVNWDELKKTVITGFSANVHKGNISRVLIQVARLN